MPDSSHMYVTKFHKIKECIFTHCYKLLNPTTRERNGSEMESQTKTLRYPHASLDSDLQLDIHKCMRYARVS